jgi:hypothetical protein
MGKTWGHAAGFSFATVGRPSRTADDHDLVAVDFIGRDGVIGSTSSLEDDDRDGMVAALPRRHRNVPKRWSVNHEAERTARWKIQ